MGGGDRSTIFIPLVSSFSDHKDYSNIPNPSIIYLLQICEGLEISIDELVKSL